MLVLDQRWKTKKNIKKLLFLNLSFLSKQKQKLYYITCNVSLCKVKLFTKKILRGKIRKIHNEENITLMISLLVDTDCASNIKAFRLERDWKPLFYTENFILVVFKNAQPGTNTRFFKIKLIISLKIIVNN